MQAHWPAHLGEIKISAGFQTQYYDMILKYEFVYHFFPVHYFSSNRKDFQILNWRICIALFKFGLTTRHKLSEL